MPGREMAAMARVRVSVRVRVRVSVRVCERFSMAVRVKGGGVPCREMAGGEGER